MGLIIFDADGTLISSYLDNPDKDYTRWHVLPGRREKLAQLRAEGHLVGIATNQAGVAFAWKDQAVITEEDVWSKMAAVLEQVGLPMDTPVAVCFAHPKSRDERYSDPRAIRRRKPCGAMLLEIILEWERRGQEVALGDVVMVGDRPEDEGAAADAGVRFVRTTELFPEPVTAAADGVTDAEVEALF